MYKMYFDMLQDCVDFCKKSEEFIERQKKFMEDFKNGKDFKELPKIEID